MSGTRERMNRPMKALPTVELVGGLVYALAFLLFVLACALLPFEPAGLADPRVWVPLVMAGLAALHVGAAATLRRKPGVSRTLSACLATVWSGLAVTLYGGLIGEGLPIRNPEYVWLGLGAALAAGILFTAAAFAARERAR